MSHVPDDLDPNEPRRPRPKRDADPGGGPTGSPPEHPPRAGYGDSVFRPSPGVGGPSPSPSRPGPARKSGKAADGTLRQEAVAPGPKWYERILFGRVSSGQLAQFCRQFASYLNAGVDYDRSLVSLGRQFQRTAFGPVLERMRLRIKAGSTLEEATAPEKAVFGSVFQSMIRVAEARGGVPETLRMLSQSYESRQRMIRQARSAMIYPLIVLFMASSIACLMAIFILPMFASLLADISKKAQLPWASRGLLAFSGFVSSGGWWILPLLLFGVPFALLQWYKTPLGRSILDRILLRIPVLGSIFRKLDVSRFARTLSSLLDAGVDVGSSIELTAQALSMTPMREAVESTKLKVLEGRELSVALAPTRQFGPDVIAILESGEETGRLPETLNHLADEYEEQAAHMVKNLGQLIQPLLILILAGFVLFIILAVFLPYIQLITSLAGG
ncbi:type II secretion system F family protein [Planctomyces sp. SH-PL62]|uniref:type II secretion system F family protein n=1 Tax=Planctomyces sp. SH-PL62 TaxID=1636152 RepID=UPI00078E4BC5|nr:type II secretion system F family protein [Planctomyces sp. SH-PL62]AMV39416.1 Type II secretion system protein F [Planctomyces sp. SH-PL62]